MKFTNFNDQANDQPLTLEELGGAMSVKFAASIKSPFHCSKIKPSSDCSESGDIPNLIECSLSDTYGHSVPLATCTIASDVGSCTSNCETPQSLCEA